VLPKEKGRRSMCLARDAAHREGHRVRPARQWRRRGRGMVCGAQGSVLAPTRREKASFDGRLGVGLRHVP